MADSTSFSIRRDLLNLARETLSENAYMRINFANEQKVQLKDPPTFTTEDIIKEATKLYAFVSKK